MTDIPGAKYHISSFLLQEKHAEKLQVPSDILSICYMQEENKLNSAVSADVFCMDGHLEDMHGRTRRALSTAHTFAKIQEFPFITIKRRMKHGQVVCMI